MSHTTFVSGGHNDFEVSREHSVGFRFHYALGISTGGPVVIQKFVEAPGKTRESIEEIKVNKDALLDFVAHLVRQAKVERAGGLSAMEALGL